MTDTDIKRIPAPEPGIYPGVPFETYLAWDAVNASLLKDVGHAPALAYDHMTNPDPDKKAYVKGRLFHLLSTGATNADEEFIVTPETYPTIVKAEDSGWTVKSLPDPGNWYEIAQGRGKARTTHRAQILPTTDGGYAVQSEAPPESHALQMNKWNGNAKVCQEWAADRAGDGKTIVKADEYTDASGMAEQVRKHPKLGPLLAGAQVEVSVVWMDAKTGLKCKARFDLYKEGVICDLKSSSSPAWAANELTNPFFHNAYRYGYHIQVAHYMEGLKALAMTERVPWVVLAAVEGYSPYLLMAYDIFDDPQALSYDFLTLGRLRRYMLMVEYKRCLESGEWPGYKTEHEDMMLPYRGVEELKELQGRPK